MSVFAIPNGINERSCKLFIFIQYLINFQTPWCSTKENLDCVSSIKVKTSDCLQQCSGILVTSYEQQEIEDTVSKLAKYMIAKSWDFKNLANDIEGL